jgi:archaemetzincin
MDAPQSTTIDLVPIYLAGRKDLIGRLVERVGQRFRMPVRARNRWFDPEAAYDLSRGQYNSRLMLKLLLADPATPATRVIGVTSVDLFTPVLTYVFGEAQLNGRAAVVSCHRFQPEAYGLGANEALLFARLETETVHELGHTFGLLHCNDVDCVMHASTYVEEIDLKSASFCTVCLRQLISHEALAQPA